MSASNAESKMSFEDRRKRILALQLKLKELSEEKKKLEAGLKPTIVPNPVTEGQLCSDIDKAKYQLDAANDDLTEALQRGDEHLCIIYSKAFHESKKSYEECNAKLTAYYEGLKPVMPSKEQVAHIEAKIAECDERIIEAMMAETAAMIAVVA